MTALGGTPSSPGRVDRHLAHVAHGARSVSGAHRLQVRATDRSGYTQVAPRTATIPDGATGWHTVDVTAI